MQSFNKKNKQILIHKDLPHNFLAEKMVLNCLLVNIESVELTIQTLPVDGFYFKNHQEIYKAIIFMYKNKLTINILSLITFLQDNGLLEKIGGIRVLIEVINEVPNLVYLEEYLRLMKDKFLRRKLIKLGYEMINSGYITNISLENTLMNFENKLFNLVTEIKTQKLFSSAELLNKLFKGVRLDQVGAGVQVGRVDVADQPGLRQHQQVVVAAQVGIPVAKARAAIVLFREPFALDHGPHPLIPTRRSAGTASC